jgi:hypothetical protein
MISKGAAMGFLAVSLVIANVILFRGFSRSSWQNEEEHVYRYSKTIGKFFLFMIPAFAVMAFVIYSSESKPPEGSGLVLFSVLTIAMTAFPIFGYAYATRYRVSVDARGITIVSIFRSRFVAFSDIAAVATIRGKGVDYLLFSASNQCIARIGGSVQDFSSLQHDVERATRSTKVTLYDFATLRGWQERVNCDDGDWSKSEGPPLIRARNRRLNFEMVIGGLLVVALVAYIHFFLR